MTDLHARLDAVVPELIAQHHVPGVAVGVTLDGRTLTTGYGVTNVAHPIAVDPHTLFQVGSISKTLLGAVIGRLLEQGALDLDSPVAPLFDAGSGIDERITLRHTITHTSGIDAQNMIADAPRILADHCDDSIQASLRHFIHQPLMFEPGTDFTYSGPGIMLAAAAVERATGRPYADLLRELVIGPAGMEITGTSADEAIFHRVAAPHGRAADGSAELLIDRGWQRHWQLPGWDVPGGGVISNVADLLRYAAWSLSDAAPRRLFEPLAGQGIQGHDIGLAWHLDELGGHRVVSHSGLTIGYASRMVLMPSVGLSYAVLTNSLHGGGIVSEVEKTILDAAGVSRATPSAAPIPADLASALRGTYDCGFYGTISIVPGSRHGEMAIVANGATIREGGYVIELEGADRVALAGPDCLITLSDDGTPGPLVGFVQKADGIVSAVRYHSRLNRRIA
ncbi:serine hydrolase domain-containing protein [Embleya scabrispora]|uniref:serine hydrolase domain-containing protein n=1 Tax=Embleya scabrispora TaxID=159449 RepID=UPI001374DB8A|nr:serine hydrolase domain-containing protein [Embleya scabrispora]